MDAAGFVRMAVGGSSYSMRRLAAVMGVAPTTLSNVVNRDRDVKCGKLAAIADVLGYDIVAVPKGSRLPNGSVRIDPVPLNGRGGDE